MEPEMHVDELAELYALGELDERESARLEAHIAQCAACLRRVGEAEETVLALESATKPIANSAAEARSLDRRRPPVWWWAVPAIAAAFVIGLLLPRPAPEANRATLAMIHSHFAHAQFSGAAGAPPAKVIYARDRSWYYVIVDSRARFDVYGLAGARASLLGTTENAGAASELFVRAANRLDRLQLRSEGKTLEEAAVR